MFHFTRLHYPDKIIYHVSVFGEFANRYFTMVHADGDWQFEKPKHIAEWTKEKLEELREALDNHYLS